MSPMPIGYTAFLPYFICLLTFIFPALEWALTSHSENYPFVVALILVGFLLITTLSVLPLFLYVRRQNPMTIVGFLNYRIIRVFKSDIVDGHKDLRYLFCFYYALMGIFSAGIIYLTFYNGMLTGARGPSPLISARCCLAYSGIMMSLGVYLRVKPK